MQKQAIFGVEQSQALSKYFTEQIYIFQYEGIIRKAILNYKFNEKSYLYKTFVNFLLKNKKIFQILETYDTIIPVPISKKRMKQRGYNQSLLIARELVYNLNNTDRNSNKNGNKNSDIKLGTNQKINLNTTSLYKTKNITEQSKLDKESRLKNIQGVYELRNMEKLKNKKILLIDDIYTTGSTANECCKILSRANPSKIGVLTIAKD